MSIQKSYNKAHKPLKADEILAQRSAVPAIDSRKRPAESRTTDGVLQPSLKKRKSGGVSAKELQRLKGVAFGGDAARNFETSEGPTYDPWAVTANPTPAIAEEKLDFIEKPKPKVVPKTLSQAPVPLTANGKPVPAVRKPEAGKSYNPDFNDWDELVTKEGQKEVEAERKRLQEAADEEAKQDRIEAAWQEAEENEKYQTDNESAWEGFESEYEGKDEQAPAKRPERKTQAQRNKIRKRKEAERQAKHERRMKERLAHQGVSIKKDLVRMPGQDVIAAERGSDSSSEEGDDQFLRRRAFGGRTMSAPPILLAVAVEQYLTACQDSQSSIRASLTR